jgi:hypothetical protein
MATNPSPHSAFSQFLLDMQASTLAVPGRILAGIQAEA